MVSPISFYVAQNLIASSTVLIPSTCELGTSPLRMECVFWSYAQEKGVEIGEYSVSAQEEKVTLPKLSNPTAHAYIAELEDPRMVQG